MAINVVSSPRLACSPSPTQLPIRLDVRQTLVSSRSAEFVTFEYALDQAHNVWFATAAGLSKKNVRHGEVFRSHTAIHHRLKLLVGPGSGPMDVVQITQTIIDATGRKSRNVCSVVNAS